MKRLLGRFAAKGRTYIAGLGVALLVAAAAVGCDRADQQTESSTVDEQQDSSEDEHSVADDAAYPGLEDIDPIEPFDVGPDAPAIYFTSGLKGYTEPCGCTADVLLGGIDRITAFVRDARQLHSDAVSIDAGDWLFEYDEIPEHQKPQEEAKAEVLAEAHRRMETMFSVPGNRDLALGVPFYRAMMESAGMVPLGANIELNGQPLEPARQIELGDEKVLFVAAAQPDNYDEVEDVEVTEPVASIAEALEDQRADVVILVFQGSAFAAEAIVDDIDDVDFAIVGHDPQRREDAWIVDSTHFLEAYDQGRYVGRLKLYGAERDGTFEDGRAGVRHQRDSLDQQIDNIRTDLRRLEVRTEGRRTEMTERLERRLEELEQRRHELLTTEIEIPEQRPGFIYDLIAMEPGYRLDEQVKQSRHDYNRTLADLIAEVGREPPEPGEDEPFFVGQQQCQSCHGDAYRFWDETAHASAVETLRERHKQHDQNCIGCHVDGWEQPGGSVLGSIEYEAQLGDETFAKDLHEVGCESCHGPGSDHVQRPLDEDGQPQHIVPKPGETECVSCHVPDHSPTFDFDVYVERITGEGHEYSGND